MPQAMTVSQVSSSGSSPTQHGHRTLQVQTSSSLPSISYAMSRPPLPVFGRSTDIGRSTESTPGAGRCQAPSASIGHRLPPPPATAVASAEPSDRPPPDPNDVAPAVAELETIVSLSKRRGFIFPSSEIYGGINAVWDYGPLGVELKNNVKRAWWRAMVQERDDIVGPRRRDPHAPAGLGDVRPRRVVQRPARRVRDRPQALPARRAAGRREPVRDRPARPDDRRAARAALPGRRRAAVRAAPVQPDVQDVHGPGRGGRLGHLPPPRDRPGLVRQLQERPSVVAQEAAVRDRPDRQVVPQRDQPGQLRLPDARVRADGDAVLRPPGRGGRGRASRSGCRSAAPGTSATA